MVDEVCFKQRIKDPHFLRLVGRFLNVGVIEEGKLIPTDKGIPQGAVLSPVLANIYLHYISGHPRSGSSGLRG